MLLNERKKKPSAFEQLGPGSSDVSHFDGRPLVASQNVGCFLRLGKHLSKTKAHFPLVILLPLRPASLAHKNPQRPKIIRGMRLVEGKGRSIDQNMCFCSNILFV